MRKFHPLFSLFLLFFLLGNHSIAQNTIDSGVSNCIASNEPIKITQADGSSLTIVGKGNMNRNWTETVDGYAIVRVNGFYEYADKINGKLVANGIRVHEEGQRDIREIAAISRIPKSLEPDQVPLKGSILSQVVGSFGNKNMPTVGSIKVLALLIEYPDLQSIYTLSDFDSLLNGNGYKNGESFRSYFLESSNGLLQIQVDVFGWYTANNNSIYYSDNNGKSKAAELVREAVDAAEMAGVDFSQYDNDSDGDVDGIMAVHSGPGAEQGGQNQYIWSHRWGLGFASPSQSVFYDGTFIHDYIINPETRSSWSGTKMVGIGVFCHEFGHNLGIPDLYDTDDSNGDSEGLGNWCVMAGGGWLGSEAFPADFSAWPKIEMGWKSPTTISPSAIGSYSLNPASQSANDLYRINIPATPNEYFLLENRQNLGLDTMLPGSGLAIYHINTFKTSLNSGVNADENNKGVDLEEADAFNDLDNSMNRGDAGDLFPGSSANNTFNANSFPNSKSINQNPSNIDINNISENANIVTFNFGNFSMVACNGLTTLNATIGSFSDGSNTFNYTNNQNCSWLIQPTGGATSIDLTFASFDTEAIHDSVTVYDGSSTSAPILGSFSGNNLPPMISSTGGSMFVTFQSNSSVTAQGWVANYNANFSSVFLDATIDTLTINAAYGSFGTIPINSNVNWAATDNVPWAIPNTGFGNGSANITVTAIQPNIGPKRYGKFYVSDATNGLIDSVVIEQLGSGKYLNISPNIILFPVNPSQDDSIMIQSNVNWNLSNNLSWLSFTQTSGGTDAKIYVTATANTGNLSRFGSIDIQGSTIPPKNIVVFQAGPLYVSPTNITLAGNPESFKASSDNQTPISASSPQSWLSTVKSTIAGNSGDPDTSLFQIIASKNGTSVARTGIIVVNDTWSKDTVYITQLPSQNYVQTSPDTLHFTPSGGSGSFDVFSDTTWIISSSASFIALSKTSGTYDDNISVSVNQNTNSFSREQVIYISAVNDPQILDSVLIIQEGISPFYINVNPSAAFLTSSSGSKDSLEVNSNVNWTINHTSSWISISPSTGTGLTKVMITALSDNLTGADRMDTLVFSSPQHADVEIEVTQVDGSSPSFSVSVDTVYLMDFQGSQAIFTVISNQSWNIVENTSWLILNPLSGTGVKDIQLMAASKNIYGNKRFAQITVSSAGFANEEITVIQLGSNPLLSVSRDSIMMPSDSGRIETFSIASNLNTWNLSSNASWIDVSPNSGGFTQMIEIMTTDSNDTKSIRADSILLTAPPHVPIYVKVMQDTAMTVGLNANRLMAKLEIYPNPVRNILNIEFDGMEHTSAISVNLYDAIGKKITLPTSWYGNRLMLDVSNLEGGFYFLEINDVHTRISRTISVVGQF